MDSNELAELEKRAGVVSRRLLWVTGRNRSTGAAESIGLWDGDDVQVFNIGGNRTYFGPAIISSEPIRGGAGLDVRYVSVEVGAILPEVEQMLRGYDPRLAAVEMHQALFNAATNVLVTAPRRVFSGALDELRIRTGNDGGPAVAELHLASAARALTKTLPLTRSDAAQRARSSGDLFRRWVSQAGREVFVGEERPDAT